MKVNDIRPDSLVDAQRQAYLKDVEFYRKIQSQFVARNCPGCQDEHGFEFTDHLGFSFKKCNLNPRILDHGLILIIFYYSPHILR